MRIEVVPTAVTLTTDTTSTVFLGALSLPIRIEPSDLPTEPEKFHILYTGGELGGLETVAL